jgi:hypothetical protein
MLNPELEQELRFEFVEVGGHIQAPDDLTERLLAQDYRLGGRTRFLVPVIVCLIALMALAGVLVAVNVGNRQPVAASVLASEFNVFDRPTSSSDVLPAGWALAHRLIARKGTPTAIRLLASHPGYGVVSVYALTYPNQICRLEMETNGGDGACTDTRSVETGHVDFGTVSGSSIQPFAIGLVANDVTSVEINSVTAPILKNNFFLAPISDPNPPFNITIHRSDGPPISKTVGGIAGPAGSDSG